MRTSADLKSARAVAIVLLSSWAAVAAAQAPETDAVREAAVSAPADERFALHGQVTIVDQGTAAFTSPYRGPNSLDPGARGRETADVTLYFGLRLWRGGELWVDPEVDQGFGLDNTLGVAGFLSGEAYKVGKRDPYLRLHRIFVRQTLDLPGEPELIAADLSQLAGGRSQNRVVVTFGKISVADIFDTNRYANSARGDFLNWSIINTGSFDYAADSWGYTAGAAVEWYQGRWTARGGAFLLSNVPNSVNIDTRFQQFELAGEIEERHSLFGLPGKLRLTGYVNRARMARLDDAVALAATTGGPPDVAAVRRYRARPGASVNLEQQVADDLGVFARVGDATGAYEAYDFTDIDRTASGGLSLLGKRWGRPNDTIGLAGVVNEASRARVAYLAAGGLGVLIGDGRLPHPGSERIVEAYYDLAADAAAHVALDYQWVTNPGYNRDRGPASVFALRLHGQF